MRDYEAELTSSTLGLILYPCIHEKVLLRIRRSASDARSPHTFLESGCSYRVAAEHNFYSHFLFAHRQVYTTGVKT